MASLTANAASASGLRLQSGRAPAIAVIFLAIRSSLRAFSQGACGLFEQMATKLADLGRRIAAVQAHDGSDQRLSA